MPKAKTAALRREIKSMAAEIHQKRPAIGNAGRKELAFIRKHLRKALKEIRRTIPAAPTTHTAARKSAPPPKKGPSKRPQKRYAVKPRVMPGMQEGEEQ